VTVRKCSTCKHYEPAPIWRKGWCRNPLLYSPQQSHLVGEDDLDCDRGMGNYWEPIEGPSVGATARNAQATEERPEQRARVSQPDDLSLSAMSSSPGPRTTTNRTTDDRGGEMNQYPPSGPRRNTDDFDDDEDTGRPTGAPSDPNRPGGNDRQFTYYPEERYWTDYLRIAAPVLGVIVLLGLAWFWLSHLIGGGGGTPTTPPATSTSGNSVIISGSPTTTSITGSPAVVATATSTNTSGTPTNATSGKLQSGAAAVVANTGGTGVNMRDAPSTSGNVVGTLSEGAAVTITGDSTDADGYTWWPVKTSDGKTGYVVADYLEPSS